MTSKVGQSTGRGYGIVTGREYVGMYVTVLKGLGVGLVILIGMLALWGLQVHLIEVLAAALGATAIEAREWGGLGGVPTVLELLGGTAEKKGIIVGSRVVHKDYFKP